ELFAIERHSSDEWLSILLDDTHPWLVSCTLHLIGERRLVELEERVVRHLKARDPIVRESACFTLARILSAGPPVSEQAALQKSVSEVAADSVPEVRRASSSLMALLSPIATS